MCKLSNNITLFQILCPRLQVSAEVKFDFQSRILGDNLLVKKYEKGNNSYVSPVLKKSDWKQGGWLCSKHGCLS